MALRHRPWSLAACLCVTGCVTPDVAPVAPTDASAVVSGIVDGATTKEEVLFRLGTPSSSFEEGRILSYQLTEPEPGERFGRARSGEYDLVLVFAADRVLTRHSLVRVHR